jgi:hypothetical protein
VKWVVARGVGATAYYRLGYAKALVSCGHDVFQWDPDAKPANDLFAENEFDAAIIGTWELSPAFVRHAVNKGTRVFLWAPNWGPYDCQVDPNDPLDTVQLATDREKALAGELTKGGTSTCFTYYPHRHVVDTHGHWRDLGLEPHGLPLAADVLTYPLTRPDPNLASDWVFVGGRWPAKSHCLDPYILPLCHPSVGLSGKIFGNGHWPVPQHLGLVDDAAVPRLFASARSCPCVFEPVSVKHPHDCSERPWKIMSSGGLAVSQRVRAAEELLPEGAAVFVDDPAGMTEVVRHFARRPEHRLPHVERGVRGIYMGHTYHHRVAAAFRVWGLEGEALACETAYAHIRGRIADRALEFAPHLSPLVRTP